MNFLEITSKFKNIKVRGDTQVQCCCPAHDDKHASLSISSENGKTLLHCHAGCSTESILEAVGLQMRDLFENSECLQIPLETNYIEKLEAYTGKKVEEIYRYFSVDGIYAYEKVRFAGKDFLYGRYNSETDRLDFGLGGQEKLLYHLLELRKAIDAGERVFLVEGEKDVHSLESLGLTATTAGGVQEWQNGFSRYFLGANQVVILPDNDDPGRKMAIEAYTALKETVKKVVIVSTATTPKGDVSDYLFKEGHSKAELMQLVEDALTRAERLEASIPKAPAAMLVINPTKERGITALELQKKVFKPKEWYLDRILGSGVAILAGLPKKGKSWLAVQLALSIARGEEFWGRTTQKTKVYYIAEEDPEERLQERIELLLDGQDAPENLRFDQDVPDVDNGLLDILEDQINKGYKVIFIDTFQYVRGKSSSSNVYAADYESICKFKAIADKHRVCIVLIHHTKKKEETEIFNNISGSTGITGAADTLILLDRRDGNRANLIGTGRDIEEFRLRLELTSSHQWRCIGGDSIKSSKVIYMENPIVRTANHLLTTGNNVWQGTATEFVQAMKTLGFDSMNANVLGRKLRRLSFDLKHYDGIEYIEPESSSTRIHTLRRTSAKTENNNIDTDKND